MKMLHCKYLSCFLVLFISVSATAQVSKNEFRSRETYFCLDRDYGEKMKKPELKEVEFYNSEGIKILLIEYKNKKIEKYTSYQIDSIGKHIGYVEYNSFGDVLQRKEPMFDSTLMRYIPLRFTNSIMPCGSMNPKVECNYDKYGNVKKKVVYSANNSKKIFRIYKYAYVR